MGFDTNFKERSGASGVEANGLLKMSFSIFVFFLLQIHMTKVFVGDGVVRVQGYGLLVFSLGLEKLFLNIINIP